MPPIVFEVLLLSLMNPGTLGAGFLLGRRADQPQKLIVCAFAAGIVGALFAWLLMATGLYAPKIRLLGGVFVASAVLGVFWGWLGYSTRKWMSGT